MTRYAAGRKPANHDEVYGDGVPRPAIKRGCFRCGVTPEDIADNNVVVSPRGTAHHGEDYGATSCGNDATGDGWWWPL